MPDELELYRSGGPVPYPMATTSNQSTQLPEHFLVAGLDALTRSHRQPTAESGFGHGHRAAALLSAYFFLKEGRIEAAAVAPIQALAEHFTRLPEFAPLPEEEPVPGEINRLLAALVAACGTDQAHGVIFPSLALRAFHLRPDLITRSRIDGLMRMAQAYTRADPLRLVHPSRPFSPGAFANEVLAGFIASTQAYRGLFQGYSFHLLTFGQAVQDLHKLGHAEIVDSAEAGFRIYLANCLLAANGPNREMAFPVTDPTKQMVRPEQAAFWQALNRGAESAQGLGHIIKYAYAFTALSHQSTDAKILDGAREQYYLSAWG